MVSKEQQRFNKWIEDFEQMKQDVIVNVTGKKYSKLESERETK